MTVGSLFTGIGGFELGFEEAGGFEVAWMCEKDRFCRELLAKKWPEVPIYGDIRESVEAFTPVDLVCGGDPCPAHSTARAGRPSSTPDLSGYFLAVVGRLSPRWVVRENVSPSTAKEFGTVLEHLGYRACVVQIDAAGATCQSRVRFFVVGCRDGAAFGRFVSQFGDGFRRRTTRLGTRGVVAALTAHRTRYDSRDNFIFEVRDGAGAIRILDNSERERLAGFPQGWTTGFSNAARARMTGNAVVPGCVAYIARCIRNESRSLSGP